MNKRTKGRRTSLQKPQQVPSEDFGPVSKLRRSCPVGGSRFLSLGEEGADTTDGIALPGRKLTAAECLEYVVRRRRAAFVHRLEPEFFVVGEYPTERLGCF